MRAEARRPDGLAKADGEYPLTWADFDAIKNMIYADAGIVLDTVKVPLLYSRLAKRLRALGMESFRDYCALVESGHGVDERQQMLAALTTNVTRFFREPHHFQFLRETALPPLIERARAGGAVRIWSAGCSTGQEPFSIALTVLSLMPDAPRHNIRILATDIDPNVLAVGRSGEYESALVEDIPADIRKRWLRSDRRRPTHVGMKDEVMGLVHFKGLNLNRDWPMRQPYQIVFCRNVVIYFDKDTQQRLWSRFESRLDTGGFLFVGHSERVAGPATDRLRSVGLTIYGRETPR